jgi:hypothetical protein
VAHVFYEARLQPGKIVKAMQRFKDTRQNSGDEDVNFDRPKGSPPALVRIDESKLAGVADTDPFFPRIQEECMASEYARIIRQQLDRLAGDERPMDLLVLVPSVEGMERVWAVGALRLLQVPFIDYTVDENRRDIAQPEMVRLCTFHSARGLEGMRLVLFGIERIERVSDEVKVDFAKLGYIALSRSLFECVIAVRPGLKNCTTAFLEAALDVLPSD